MSFPIDSREESLLTLFFSLSLHWYLAIIVNPQAVLHLVLDPDKAAAPLRTSARHKAQTSPETTSAAPSPPQAPPEAVPATTTSHYFSKSNSAVEVEQQREEEEERQREAKLASQMSAEAAQTETGGAVDDSSDIIMADGEASTGDVDVVMGDSTEDPQDARANSPACQPSATEANGDESSSDDDEEAVKRGLGVDAPSSAQPPPRPRPNTPPKALSRVATPIEPSRTAPGDPPPFTQAQEQVSTRANEDETMAAPPPSTRYDPDK